MNLAVHGLEGKIAEAVFDDDCRGSVARAVDVQLVTTEVDQRAGWLRLGGAR